MAVDDKYNFDLSGLIVVGHHISLPQIINQDLRLTSNNNIIEQLEPTSSDDLMVVEEKNTQSFANSNFGNHI